MARPAPELSVRDWSRLVLRNAKLRRERGNVEHTKQGGQIERSGESDQPHEADLSPLGVLALRTREILA